MLLHLKEKETEQKAWEMWLTKYPNMDKTNFVPFSEFKSKLTTPQISTKSTEDILKEVEEIRKKIAKKGGK